MTLRDNRGMFISPLKVVRQGELPVYDRAAARERVEFLAGRTRRTAWYATDGEYLRGDWNL